MIDGLEVHLPMSGTGRSKGPDLHHYEQVMDVQATLKQQVLDLIATIEDVGNPLVGTFWRFTDIKHKRHCW